jgi:hypothetical protein
LETAEDPGSNPGGGMELKKVQIPNGEAKKATFKKLKMLNKKRKEEKCHIQILEISI